jgi:hypothetical protein
MVKVYVEYPGLNIYNGESANSGFNTKILKDTNFEALGKLGHLGLGFFNDTNIPIYKGGLEVTIIMFFITRKKSKTRWKQRSFNFTFRRIS